MCGAEFDIESGGRTSAITETDHDSAIANKTDHDSAIVYETELDTTSNINESNINTLSDVDNSTFIETPIISSKISSDKPEEPETAPPASACCPPEVCSSVGTKKKVVSMATDLSSLLTDVAIISNQANNREVSVNTQDDLIPELMVLPCGHLHCHEGTRPSTVRCVCGRLFDLLLCDKAVTYARAVKYTL